MAIQTQLDFSTRSSATLKSEYDLLQSKLDKFMKTANNQLTERDSQIAKTTERLTVLENFYEESQQIMEEAKKKNE